MSITLSPTFKNDVLDMLTGNAPTPSYSAGYIQVFSGAQPADPDTAPAGTAAAVASSSPNVATFMGAAGGGVSALTATRTATATNSITASFARLFDVYAGTPLADMPVSVTGGGGGVILNSLTITAGNSYSITAFSIKFPTTIGSVSISTTLANALAEAVSGASTTAPGLFAGGVVSVYSGAAPASANDAATGTLLWQKTLPTTTPWNMAVGGAASLGTAQSATASASGTAGYVRVTKDGYTLQGSVGTTTGDFLFNTLAMTSGSSYSLTDATLVF